MIATALALGALAAPLVAATSYPLKDSWSGDGFIDGWDYPAATYDNTTSGDVFWATSANTSLIYVNDAGRVVLKVDNTSTVAYNEKRYAPELISKTGYAAGTVFVMDAVHLPYGCSVWPSFWTQGTDWPTNGEIDIFEGVNLQTTNQMALHAEGNGCYASDSVTFSGSMQNTNCSTSYNSNEGCSVLDNSTASYGAAFASAGGGVFVAEYAEEWIKIWFITRDSVPSSLSSNATTIDTDDLGTPSAYYPSSTCDIDTYFGDQRMTLDITLCGSWAGTASVLEETCDALVGDATCYTTYVEGTQTSTYANAYFEINYVNVYTNASTSTSSSSSSAASARSVVQYGAVAGVAAAVIALLI